MADNPEIRARLQSKLERAEKHILNLDKAWRDFVEGGAYEVVSDDDPQTGERVFKIGTAMQIGPLLGLLVGDAIHNLRSALDHLAYHLVCVGTRNFSGPHTHVYFPIFRNRTEYEAKKLGKIKGMSENAIKAIDGIEPYGGGAGDIFWGLDQLDIFDKHRILLPLGLTNGMHSMGVSARTNLMHNFLGVYEFDHSSAAKAFLTAPQTVHFPLKAGHELGRFPKGEADENMHFVISVAFGEPHIVKGQPVVVTLHKIAKRCRDIIYEFDDWGLL